MATAEMLPDAKRKAPDGVSGRSYDELAAFERFSDIHLTFLDQLTESIGIVLNTIAANMRTEDLLKQSQSLTQNLQSQQEELKKTNEQLEEKVRLLSAQKTEIELKNQEVELAKKALEEKAEQLALTSKYKSQFLANMSHELRTPLNSLLILAKLLYENPEGNLTPKQVEFSKTVHSSGSDLLTLINEILDMSKIESGMITVEIGELEFSELKNYVEWNFRQVAQNKSLDFSIELAQDLPKSISTDSKRLQQVLKNLLSNAFKFTEKGSVSLRIEVARKQFESPALRDADTVIAFSVADTGIGIPADKQKIIFEAFQQADMTTSRKYGGTGLGLTISREIARLLGGKIIVESRPGEGSSFTLLLPRSYTSAQKRPAAAAVSDPEQPQAALPSQAPDWTMTGEVRVNDDRDFIAPGDRTLLIVEDNIAFTPILLNKAREQGFKGIVAQRGGEALAELEDKRYDCMVLDLGLSDVSGLDLLEEIRKNSACRQLPVIVYTGRDLTRAEENRLKKLAKSIIIKDVESAERLLDEISLCLHRVEARLPEAKRKTLEKLHQADPALARKKVLVVDDDVRNIFALTSLLETQKVEVLYAENGKDGIAMLEKAPNVDVVLMDVMMPEMDGYETMRTIRKIAEFKDLPIIALTAKAMKGDREKCIEAGASDYIAKPVEAAQLLSMLRVWMYA